MPAGRLAELTGLTTDAVTGIIDRFEEADMSEGQMIQKTDAEQLSSVFRIRNWKRNFK